jgi:hypothetical protein
MKTYYCWRCKKQMPLLDEDEWSEIQPFIKSCYGNPMDKYDEIKWARRVQRQQDAVKKFEELTCAADVAFDVIEHHRLLQWGEECRQCGELLRTPKARYCCNCGLLVSS